jgi:outer membrane protein insertion porin family
MKDTETKNVFRILKASKFIKEKYKTDLEKCKKPIKKDIDARILSDSVSYLKEKNALLLK